MEVRFFGADIVVDDIEGISEAYCRNGAPDLSCVFLDVLFTFCFANVFLVLLKGKKLRAPEGMLCSV